MKIEYSKLIQGLRRAGLLIGILSASMGAGLCLALIPNLDAVNIFAKIEWAWRISLLTALVVSATAAA